jgi:hypothetical protein
MNDADFSLLSNTRTVIFENDPAIKLRVTALELAIDAIRTERVDATTVVDLAQGFLKFLTGGDDVTNLHGPKQE